MLSGREFTFQLQRSCSIHDLLDMHLLPAMEEQGVPWLGSYIQFKRDDRVVNRDHTLGSLRGAQESNVLELSMVLHEWQFDRAVCRFCNFTQRPMNLEEEQRVAKAMRHQEKGFTIHLDEPPYSAVSCLFCPRVALSCQRCRSKPSGWRKTYASWWLCPACSAEKGDITFDEAFSVSRAHFWTPQPLQQVHLHSA